LIGIKEARENAGFTQKDAAERLCVSQQAVQQWESGKTVPQADRLVPLAKILKVSFSDLCGWLITYSNENTHLRGLGVINDEGMFCLNCMECNENPLSCISDCNVKKYRKQEKFNDTSEEFNEKIELFMNDLKKTFEEYQEQY
jgi:transcriptional regulator with XRE-family HTH domain